MDKDTLGKYYNTSEQVEIIGRYVGPPKKHENVVKHGDNNFPENERFNPIYECVEGQLIRPLRKMTTASCLTDVVGQSNYQDIHEDHVNIQQDISGSDIQSGDLVRGKGIVAEYNRNADGSGSYTIELKSWEKVDEE